MQQYSSSSDHEVAEKCKSDVKDEEEEEEEEEKQQEHFHVLAVDDSLVDRKLLERLLSISSYQVTCVDSGDKALEYLGLIDDHIHQEEEEAANEDGSAKISELMKSDSPCPFSSNKSSNQQKQVSKVNLIITDYSMPGITGYDLLMKLKESSWKDIPVIVVSSEDVPSRISMCLEGGAQEFLLKPVKLSDLSKIHSHLLNSNCNYTNIDAFEIDADDDKDINCTNNNPNKRKAAKTLPSAISDIMPRAKELSVS